MTRATWMKFAAGVLLFGAWLGLVLAQIAPPAPLIDAIGYALVGLGIYHAAAADGQLGMKFVSGLMLFGAWLSLVVVHLAPAAGLIDAIGYTLAGLGIYQAKGIVPLPARTFIPISTAVNVVHGSDPSGGRDGTSSDARVPDDASSDDGSAASAVGRTVASPTAPSAGYQPVNGDLPPPPAPVGQAPTQGAL
ncbi:hypothetical protein [Burkholderia sp. BC1]|uniref:hypothetical protein n=1 Tax=Burkholderia sp. BC1 TaxID=1095370 RepID=UPI0040449A7B